MTSNVATSGGTEIDVLPAELAVALPRDASLAKTLMVAKKLDDVADDGRASVSIALLRNVTVEPGLPAAIKVCAARTGLRASVYLGNFDNAAEDVFDAEGPLYAASPDAIVVALRLHTVAPKLATEFAGLSHAESTELAEVALERVCSLVEALRERTQAMILVHGFEQIPSPAFGILDATLPNGQRETIRGLNGKLAVRVAALGNAYPIDVDAILSRLGYEVALEDRYWHLARAPYSFEVQQRLAECYVQFVAALKGKNKKCLVLDCDNTLWGGVVGEDGIGGIKLGSANPGSAFLEFQGAILDLYNRGIVLALNSKNNERDVLDVFEKHPESVLREHHFVATRINWQDKAANLREIAAELNLGLDALVFVDDNPFECQFVRESLPDVVVVELPKDPSRYARLLRSLPYFDTLTLSDEDRRRSAMYRAESQRSHLREASRSMDDYLRSLDMVVTVSAATEFAVPRIAQLTQKTNQFNLTTRRYAETDVVRMMSDDRWRVYFVELVDKFDSSGIVAIAFVEAEHDVARIDTFLMSCRVIGRGVEDVLLSRIANDARTSGARRLVGEYLRTPKNDLAATFYERAQFAERPGSERRWWEFDLADGTPAAPGWFLEIRND